jgi:hypothetical protein
LWLVVKKTIAAFLRFRHDPLKACIVCGMPMKEKADFAVGDET